MEALLFLRADVEPMTTAVPPLAPIRSLELAADTLSPVAAALRLGPRCAFLLESVEEGARYGRYSLVGVHGRTLAVRGGRADLPTALLRSRERLSDERDRSHPIRNLPDQAHGCGCIPPFAADRWREAIRSFLPRTIPRY